MANAAGRSDALDAPMTTPLALVKQTMPKDPHGCLMLGPDGVLRSFAADMRTVIGAAGLRPEQIAAQLDELQMARTGGGGAAAAEESLRQMQEAFAGVDGSTVTETTALFEPGPECRPWKQGRGGYGHEAGGPGEGDSMLEDIEEEADGQLGIAIQGAPAEVVSLKVSPGQRRSLERGGHNGHAHRPSRTRQDEIARIELEQEQRERELFDEIERDKMEAQAVERRMSQDHR